MSLRRGVRSLWVQVRRPDRQATVFAIAGVAERLRFFGLARAKPAATA